MLEPLFRLSSRIGRALTRLGAACQNWVQENFVKSLFGIITLVLLIIVMWPHCMIFIPAGHAGVLWSRFFGGTVMDRIYRPGAHVILPWDVMTVYDLRVQLETTELDVLTADGLHSNVGIGFRFQVDENNLTVLHEFVGPNYLDKLLVTDIASYTRRMFSNYKPEEAFMSKRAFIEDSIQAAVNKNLLENFNPTLKQNVRFIVLDDVMIQNVKLPDAVAHAIERKVEEYHRAEQYKFTLQAEAKEAERKAIEAQGIRQFQDIVRPGLSDSYLRWRGIEATLTLAQSPNSKTVIIGSGPGGLPIILGNMDDSGPKGKTETKKPGVTPLAKTPAAPPAPLGLPAPAPKPVSPVQGASRTAPPAMAK
jgi:regulator of protease activity HflC (stomatin/prohibitin superfamily)